MIKAAGKKGGTQTRSTVVVSMEQPKDDLFYTSWEQWRQFPLHHVVEFVKDKTQTFYSAETFPRVHELLHDIETVCSYSYAESVDAPVGKRNFSIETYGPVVKSEINNVFQGKPLQEE